MERVDYERIVIQDILNLHKKKELNLNPWYQRRSVWTPSQQAYLINTLFERKPVPTIYIRHTIDLENERSIKEVVDGQQRIRSILGYREGEFSARHPRVNKRVFYKDLSPADREHFLMTPLSQGILVGADESAVIDIFGRINSVAKTLNAQEKRNALFSGEFKQFCLKKSSEYINFWRTRKIFSDTSIARMQEVEFVSELTMNLLEGLQDSSQTKITNYYKSNEEAFAKWPEAEKLISNILRKLNDLPVEEIANTAFSREPLFFSLCYALKDHPNITLERLSKVIHKVNDSVISDVLNRPGIAGGS